MKQKKVAVKDFDFKGFTKALLGFLGKELGEEVHPSYGIVTVAEPGGVPEYGPETGRANFQEELEAGKLLFFPFSSSNVDEPIPCADGKKRKLAEDSDFMMGEVDCVGFLVQLKAGAFYINSAMQAGGACPGPVPSVDIMDCDLFDAPMEKFIGKFIRG